MKERILPDGVYVAALTPMLDDLTPDIDRLVKHCNALLNQGAQGLALLGTTGEANSFSTDERTKLIEAVIEHGIPAKQIMLGTGCCSYTETINLTRHAVNTGIKSILLLPPFYYKQINDEDLLTFISKVLDEVAEPGLEIYLYHFPRLTGLHFSISLIEKLVAKYPDNIVGIKDSGGDFQNMQEVCRSIPGFKVFAGTEKYLLDVLRIGGAGCISATANITLGQCMLVFNNWQDTEADKLQDELTAMRNIFEGLPFIGILKQYLARIQNIPQWRNIRPPNGLIDESRVTEVLDAMADKMVSGIR